MQCTVYEPGLAYRHNKATSWAPFALTRSSFHPAPFLRQHATSLALHLVGLIRPILFEFNGTLRIPEVSSQSSLSTLQLLIIQCNTWLVLRPLVLWLAACALSRRSYLAFYIHDDALILSGMNLSAMPSSA